MMAHHRKEEETEGLLQESVGMASPLKTAPEPVKSPLSPQPNIPGRSIIAALSPSLVTGLIVFSWYCSNIGVLLLNKYLLSIYGFRCGFFPFAKAQVTSCRSLLL